MVQLSPIAVFVIAEEEVSLEAAGDGGVEHVEDAIAFCVFGVEGEMPKLSQAITIVASQSVEIQVVAIEYKSRKSRTNIDSKLTDFGNQSLVVKWNMKVGEDQISSGVCPFASNGIIQSHVLRDQASPSDSVFKGEGVIHSW